MTGHALILGLMLLLSALVTPFFGNLHGSDLAILITTVVVGSAFMITALALYFWPTLALGAKRARSLGVPLPFAFAIALGPTVALMTALFLGVATSLDQRPLMATVGVLNSIVFLTLCMWPPQPRTPQSYQARSERSIKAKAPAGLGSSSVRKSGLPDRSVPSLARSIQAPSKSTTTSGMQRSVT